jgi:hypothetical protein
MPLCTITAGSAAFENLSYFQLVRPRTCICLFAVRAVFRAHLLIAWAQVACRSRLLAPQMGGARTSLLFRDLKFPTPRMRSDVTRCVGHFGRPSRRASGRAFNEQEIAARYILREHAKRRSPFAGFFDRAANTFKPMKFLRNGHAGAIASPADIDIAGTCFSLKRRIGPPGASFPGSPPRRLEY